MSFFKTLITPIFKQDNQGNTFYYPSFSHEGFIITSDIKKNEIIQFHKKISILPPFFILALLTGSFYPLFIFGISPIFIIFFASVVPHLYEKIYEKKLEKITKGLTKIDKLKVKVTGLSNIMAHFVSLFTLLLSFFVELFLIILLIVSTKKYEIVFLSTEFFIGIIFIVIFSYLFFITGKAIFIRYKIQKRLYQS